MVTVSCAQQGNNWYFGAYAGLTFNTNPPTALTNGSLLSEEGCATMSDAQGNLLFYTDGQTVYNKNHLAMPNGTGSLRFRNGMHWVFSQESETSPGTMKNRVLKNKSGGITTANGETIYDPDDPNPNRYR